MRISRQAQKGFTIIEILIVVGIIGMLMAILYPAYRAQQNRAKKGAASVQIRQVASSIEQYYEDVGEYPATLKDLVKEPGDEKTREKWHGPYISTKDKDAPRDPWNKPFHYQPTPDGEHPYELSSYGGDKGKNMPKKDWIDVWKI